MRRLIRAQHLGMCFGVRNAIHQALEATRHGPVTILGDLVHNQTVLDRLQEDGIRIERDPDQVETETVMVTAHGASQRTLGQLRSRGLRVLEGTCPLVHAAHRALSNLVAAGYHPVVIGQGDHVEVRGMTGDLAAFDVVLDEGDIERLTRRARYGVVSQTTQPIERVRRLVGHLRARFPGSDVRFVDTVCQPTKLRQQAAESLARSCDVVIVVGGAHSNNTRQLVETCARHGSRAFHVQTAADLQFDWIEHADTVGLTAGTSTPDEVVDGVEARLLELQEAGVGERLLVG